jgi:hypothetical protein
MIEGINWLTMSGVNEIPEEQIEPQTAALKFFRFGCLHLFLEAIHRGFDQTRE